jgi:FixJ family two-component response regulator
MIGSQYNLQNEHPTVFVIDDDPAVRQSVCWLVESGGRQVGAFDSAQAFLDSYTPDQTGCVVTDVRMPGMGGLQLQEELSNRGYTIPMIIMTAYGDVVTAVRAMNAGAIDFLEKPYNDQALLDLIEEAIKKDSDIRCVQMQGEAVRAKFDMLTPREQQVMRLIVQGQSNKTMAVQLEIATKTVEAHRAKVMEKMEVGSVAELTQLAALCV